MHHRTYIAALKYIQENPKQFKQYCKGRAKPDPTNSDLVKKFMNHIAKHAQYVLLKRHGSPYHRNNNLCSPGTGTNQRRRAHGSFNG